MSITSLRARRPLPVLTRATLGALLISALAYASEFVWIGHLDREVSIVVAVLLAASALVAAGWRWAPLLGGLLAGVILVGNPFLLINLSYPSAVGFFAAAVLQAVSSLAALGAGIAATIQGDGVPSPGAEAVRRDER